MELLGKVLSSAFLSESTDPPLVPKLYGNAGGIYQDILEEIEALSEDPLVVSRVKELAMPAIAKVLQNKLVITMNWESAQKAGVEIESEIEFTKALDNWDDDYSSYIDDLIADKLGSALAFADIRLFSSAITTIAKEKYAKFLQFFPENEHQAVLDAIANKKTYWKPETQEKFFVNKMDFPCILPKAKSHITPDMNPSEELYSFNMGLFALVEVGLPCLAKRRGLDEFETLYLSLLNIEDEIGNFVEEAAKQSGEDLACYKQWAWKNQKDPLGLVFPEDRINRELAGINW